MVLAFMARGRNHSYEVAWSAAAASWHLDFELVLAIQMFYTIVALIGSLLMDISYGLVDPRVRVDK